LRIGGYLAKFEVPDIDYRVAYTSKGYWYIPFRPIIEKKLAHDIRAIVKSTYYDDTILQVEQIEHVDAVATVYLVHLKDEQGWKIVRLCDGEMDVISKDYKKIDRRIPYYRITGIHTVISPCPRLAQA